MFPKATRKTPPHTTQPTTVHTHVSNAPGEQFTPMLPAGEWSFLPARHYRTSWSLFPATAHKTPAQSNAHGNWRLPGVCFSLPRVGSIKGQHFFLLFTLHARKPSTYYFWLTSNPTAEGCYIGTCICTSHKSYW